MSVNAIINVPRNQEEFGALKREAEKIKAEAIRRKTQESEEKKITSKTQLKIAYVLEHGTNGEAKTMLQPFVEDPDSSPSESQ